MSIWPFYPVISRPARDWQLRRALLAQSLPPESYSLIRMAAQCVKTPRHPHHSAVLRRAMHVLIATSSAFRRALYLEALNGLGHDVTVAHGGVDCVEQVRSRRPDLLLLEAPLHWGGADGVLEILQEPLNQSRTRVILLAVGAGSIDWFRLSRFRVDDVLFRLPTVPELQRAIADTAASAANHALEPTHQEACFDSALAVAEGPFQKNDREI